MSRRRGRGARWILAGGVLALSGLIPATAGPGWSGWGHVVAIDPAQGTVVLDHDAIPGLLPGTARTAFPVERPDLLRGVLAGDRVRFTLVVADDAHGLLRLAALTPETPRAGGTWPGVFLGAVAVLALGGLGASLALAVALWRSLAMLHRRVAALDHEVGMLRRLGGETQDAVREIVHALDEIAGTLLTAYVRELRRRVGFLAPGPGGGPGAGELPPALLVVQRGRTDVFRALDGAAAGPGLRVIWDRRRGERRTTRRPVPLERRRAERRAPLPDTWSRLGFVVAPQVPGEGGPAAEARGPRPLRAVGGERPPTR